MEIISGIYELINHSTEARYIGRSKNINKRWQRHLEDLRYNRHHSAYLQRSWNKYGESSFEFRILEQCEPDRLNERELFYLNNNKCAYNMIIASTGVLKHTKDTRDKMSKGQRRNWEKKRKLGIDKHSEATKNKIAKSHLGIKPNDKTRKKMGESAKSRDVSTRQSKYCKNGHLLSETRITRNKGIRSEGCGICSKKRKTKWMKDKRERLKIKKMMSNQKEGQ